MAFLACLALTLSVLGTPAAAQTSTTKSSTVSNQPPTTLTTTTTTSTPTGPVIAISAPNLAAASQVVLGSFVGSSSSISTIVLGCPDGTDPQRCYFVPSITVTAGPSTFGFTASATETGTTATTTENCQWSSAGGSCTLATYGTSSVDMTFSMGSTSTFSGALAAQQVIITADDPGDLATSASSTRSDSTSTSSDRGTSSTTTGSVTSHNDANALAPGVVGAGILGLAAVFL